MVALLKKERKSQILKHINIHSKVTFNELAEMLKVSEDTIRRDLAELSDSGEILRIRGGAMSAGNKFISKTSKTTYAFEKKHVIAKKALELIKEGMIILIGGGTTIDEFVKIIPDNFRATFITINPVTSLELLEKPNIETIILGGKLSSYSQTVVGGEAFSRLAEIKADLCIMGTNAVDATEGITDLDWESVEIKKAMFKAAKKVAILAISEKLNSVMRLRICHFEDIDFLITELSPSENILLNYKNSSVQVL
jgi:DeoR family transcriptional regulator, fructose operon transcriptional repressor